MPICKATSCILEAWWPFIQCSMQQAALLLEEGEAVIVNEENTLRKKACGKSKASGGMVRALDLAAGSGEATQALESWWSDPNSGGGGSKTADGSHRRRWPPEGPSSTLSAAAAASSTHRSVSPIRPEASGLALRIDASDPYTHQAYARSIGRPSERFSFQDVADGHLTDRSYHLCICRYLRQ
jgi:hypothetical protein